MPQFDTFIFSSSLFYFVVSFFILLYVNFNLVLPRLAAILKLRYKFLGKPYQSKAQTISVDNTVFTFASSFIDKTI